MDTQKNAGFTIIETILFLAVSGALTVGMLVGSGVAINQQRYRDSVNTLKSFVQQQYNEVTNVVNGRDGSEACNNAVVADSGDAVTPQSRGTSECILLGRHITVDTTGKRVTASNVVAYHTPGSTEAASDILEITTNYTLGLSKINQDVTDIAWGATVVRPGTDDVMPMTMLILRSPLSGSIMTYTSEGVVTKPEELKNMVSATNSSTPRHLCIDNPAGAVGVKRMSVLISAFATSQGAIQVPPESESVCG